MHGIEGSRRMSDLRHEHEETATDRWVGGMLDHRRLDTPARVGALVGRAMDGVRAGEAGGARRLRIGRFDWRTPLAAAASVAVFVGAAIMLSPGPATAGALLRAAQAAESGGGDRRYRIDLEFPAPPGEDAPRRASGTLDVRDATHVRLDLDLPDGRRMVRATDGARTIRRPSGRSRSSRRCVASRTSSVPEARRGASSPGGAGTSRSIR
ncbi:MAG: hypothetical protein ACKORL_04645 [Phycisphaerales bacterium]